jgi:predicted ATPase/class 3 adenylate cyclase/tetratricopeptide (TPR) repeat protein
MFVDIESSTRLMAKDPEAFRTALGAYRHIVGSNCAAHDGALVNTEGDGMFVAFGDPAAGCLATAATQRQLRQHPWPTGCEVRARIGLHIGLAQPLDNDYVALAVHQAARVVHAAHGGQSLVTADVLTAAQATSSIAGEVATRSLGFYRVRDFDQPVELIEIGPRDEGESGGLAGFPPLRATRDAAIDVHPPENEFLGRDGDLDRLSEAVGKSRQVTLVGPGGVGKTRLSQEFALRYPPFEHGACFVDMAAATDVGSIAVATLHALHEQAPRAADPAAAVADSLADRSMLVILDNAEQAVAAVAEFVGMLLERSSHSVFVVTSRERLGLGAERVVRVEPLRTADALTPAARDLFVARAQRAVDGWRLATDEGPVVDEICTLLDGLPLAIEMAAARCDAFAPADLLAMLHQRLRLSAAGSQGALRHRSIEQAVLWSEALLDAAARDAVRRLALFPTSFAVAGATAVLDGVVQADDVPELLATLVDKSLLSTSTSSGRRRFRMLNTVRETLLTKLSSVEQTGCALSLGRWLDDQIGPGRAPDLSWWSTLEDELETVRTIARALVEVDQPRSDRLVCSVGTYLDARSSARQGIHELRWFVDNVDAATPERVGTLSRLADLQLRVADVELAEATIVAAERLAASVGQCPWDDVAVARARGELLIRRGDLDAAMALGQQALARATGRGRARMANLLGIASLEAADFDAAVEAFTVEVEACEALGLQIILPSAHGNLAEALLRAGRQSQAASAQLRCLDAAVQNGQELMVAYTAMLAAQLAEADGDAALAVQLQAAATTTLALSGDQLFASDQVQVDQLLERCAAKLGALQYEELWRSSLPLDSLVAASHTVLARHAAAH